MKDEVDEGINVVGMGVRGLWLSSIETIGIRGYRGITRRLSSSLVRLGENSGRQTCGHIVVWTRVPSFAGRVQDSVLVSLGGVGPYCVKGGSTS